MEKAAKINRKAILKRRLASYAARIMILTSEIKKFNHLIKARSKGRAPIKSGMFVNWRNMAKRSLIATRRKIYRVEAEIKAL